MKWKKALLLIGLCAFAGVGALVLVGGCETPHNTAPVDPVIISGPVSPILETESETSHFWKAVAKVFAIPPDPFTAIRVDGTEANKLFGYIDFSGALVGFWPTLEEAQTAADVAREIWEQGLKKHLSNQTT